MAILFHGLYNYFAGIYGSLHYFAYAVIFITVLECKLRFKGVKIKFSKNVSDVREQGDDEKMSFLSKIFKFGKKEDQADTVQESWRNNSHSPG